MEKSSSVPTFDELYEAHADFVARLARRMGVPAGDVEDVTQKTFLAAYHALAAFEGRSSVKTWLYGITFRVVSTHRRSHRRKSPSWWGRHSDVDPELLAANGAGDDPHREAVRVQANEVVQSLLLKLSEERRTVFVLAELEGLSPAEIEEVTGLERVAVYARLRAAREDFEHHAAKFLAQTSRRFP